MIKKTLPMLFICALSLMGMIMPIAGLAAVTQPVLDAPPCHQESTDTQTMDFADFCRTCPTICCQAIAVEWVFFNPGEVHHAIPFPLSRVFLSRAITPPTAPPRTT